MTVALLAALLLILCVVTSVLLVLLYRAQTLRDVNRYGALLIGTSLVALLVTLIVRVVT